MADAPHPHELARAAVEALEGRASLDLLWHYLDVAIEEHRRMTWKHVPDDDKLTAIALEFVLKRIRDALDSQGTSPMVLKIGHRRKARPRTENTPAAEEEAQRKRRGIFHYERLLSEGVAPKAALQDAAKTAGMVPRNFERILESRRLLDDPDRLAEYVARGREEQFLASCAERARHRFGEPNSKSGT
jgi:hypothetical protein